MARKIKRTYIPDIKDALANKPFEISLLYSEPKPKIINIDTNNDPYTNTFLLFLLKQG